MTINLMGCFATSKAEKQCAPGSAARPATTSQERSIRPVVASRDSLSLLSNKPVVLPDPDHLLRRQLAPSRFDEKPVVVVRTAAFSGPLVPTSGNKQNDESMAFQSRLQPPRELVAGLVACSDVEGGKAKGARRTLRRAASFGGRPQPLPLPVVDEPRKLLLTVYNLPENLPLPEPEDIVVATSRTRLRARTTSVFKLEAGNTPARGGGLPLPPPSLATKLLQRSLAAVEFRQLVLATDDFAPSRCVLKSAAGDVFRARIEDPSDAAPFQAKFDVAVLRLPKNSQQGVTEWKSEVQQLARVEHRNVCAVKGYCAHEAGSRGSSRLERLLVFEQPAKGSLYEHLFAERRALDWTTRVRIALGAARGLLYLHDRAPLQIVFKEFDASTVLLENDFVPKLAGYGLSVAVPLVRQSSSSFTTSMLRSRSQAKRNVRSFGVVLLELVTGKSSRDAIYFGDDANFVHWGRQCMKGDEDEVEFQLAQTVDPRMQGGYPAKGAAELVTLSLRCVSKREAQRPSFSEIVGTLKSIKARYCSGNPEGLVRHHRRTFSDVCLSSSSSSMDASSSETEDFRVMPQEFANPHVSQWRSTF